MGFIAAVTDPSTDPPKSESKGESKGESPDLSNDESMEASSGVMMYHRLTSLPGELGPRCQGAGAVEASERKRGMEGKLAI